MMDLDDAAALAGRVADVTRPMILRIAEPTSCIITTRVIVDALNRLGVRAEPIQVECIAFNRSAARLSARGMSLDEIGEITQRFAVEDHHGPWTIHLGPPSVGEVGHVAAWLPDHRLLVDGSIDQANRPQKGMRFRPVVLGPVDEWPAPLTVDGCALAWHPDRANRRAWEKSRDWTVPERSKAITDTVVRTVAPVAC